MKIIPKFIIKNNKSGEEFKALDVYPTYQVHWCGDPDRRISIVYTDDIEQVKRVLNYDKVLEELGKRNNRILSEINDSFDLFSIEEDGSRKKICELRNLFARGIDPDYCTIDGAFEFELFNTDTTLGGQWFDNRQKAYDYAKTLKPKLFI